MVLSDPLDNMCSRWSDDSSSEDELVPGLTTSPLAGLATVPIAQPADGPVAQAVAQAVGSPAAEPAANPNMPESHVISNTGHEEMVHEAIMDHYGRRLATCSSDKTVKIFEIENDNHRLIETLRGHEGPVWSVAWAHPKYGNILASSSYDGKVFIWREQNNQWQKVYEFLLHTASVNIVSWAPHETGCLLACASTDGHVSVLEFKDNSWTHQFFQAHGLGVNSVDWAPCVAPGVMTSAAQGSNVPAPIRKLVTAGCDCTVKIWEYDPDTNTYNNTTALSGHTDWVRDAAWSKTILSKSYIASASQDKTVRIWTTANPNATVWNVISLQFEAVAWRASWSPSGNVLAVSTADNRVSLWKEHLSGEWECVKTLEE